MNRIQYRTFLVLLLFCSLAGNAFSQEGWEGGSPETYFKIVETKNTEPPSVINNKVLFFYRPDEPTRVVGAAFSHEDFVTIHPFKINDYGVFYLAYEIPRDTRELHYRLIIDGLWVSDPSNSQRVRDSAGISLSRFSIPPQTDRLSHLSPQKLGDQRVRFVYQTRPGERVYLAGSFNHWDPFLYEMKETSPGSGIYEISLNLFRGTHAYYFVNRGGTYTDPQNLSQTVDSSGREVSLLTLP